MLDRRSRTTLLIGTTIFSVERCVVILFIFWTKDFHLNRIVVYSLRALQAHSEKHRFSKGLINYAQVSFGLGFVGIANDLVNVVRCLLVNPTYGSERYPESPAAASKGGVMTPEGTPDLTRTRFWARRVLEFIFSCSHRYGLHRECSILQGNG